MSATEGRRGVIDLRCGDAREVLRTLDAESVHAVVTDPPYGLRFMGKDWDHDIPGEPFWREALRVAKPGAHLLAFGGTRTFHRLTCAIEDAGWEIRDCLTWLYGSGFPKSLDVSKALDKTNGHERPRIAGGVGSSNTVSLGRFKAGEAISGEAISGEAIRWQGWGTALKPAWEPIILARKPLRGTVAANVLEHGCGALNVDGCRLPIAEGDTSGYWPADHPGASHGTVGYNGGFSEGGRRHAAGRWPANVVLDEEAAAVLDEQAGEAGGGFGVRGRGGNTSGGPSRFYYTAKASRSERESGLEMCERVSFCMSAGAQGHPDGYDKAQSIGLNRVQRVANHHPTVKPIDLMRWLVRLVTPSGGLVLDPFMGSGSTGIAAVCEGFRFLGIDLNPEYVELARRRIENTAPLFTRVEP